ncbi:hypothetical protein D3C76_1349320 [compost metagenome]
MINQLAEAKVLEPATGKPMPGSPAFIKAGFPVPMSRSGQACPQTGYWQAVRVADYRANIKNGTLRRFEQGEIMPTERVQHRHTRFLLADKITVNEEQVEWALLGEA